MSKMSYTWIKLLQLWISGRGGKMLGIFKEERKIHGIPVHINRS